MTSFMDPARDVTRSDDSIAFSNSSGDVAQRVMTLDELPTDFADSPTFGFPTERASASPARTQRTNLRRRNPVPMRLTTKSPTTCQAEAWMYTRLQDVTVDLIKADTVAIYSTHLIDPPPHLAHVWRHVTEGHKRGQLSEE